MGNKDGCIFLCLTIVILAGGAYCDSPLECTYKHTYNTWTMVAPVRTVQRSTPPKAVKSYKNEDFIFKLTCIEQIATITYDTHVLDRFKVKSCSQNDFINDILVDKKPDDSAKLDERNVPTEVSVYHIKNKNMCYSKEYTFKNWLTVNDQFRDAGVISSTDPLALKGVIECVRGDLLETFGNCKSGFIQYNVRNVEYVTKHDPGNWSPSVLRLDPPGVPTDQDVPHTKLLACTYETHGYSFKLLCLKVHGEGYFAYVGEEDPYSVFMERFLVNTCHEHHIVNGIFMPKYSKAKPAAGPSHTIKYGNYQGHCMQRNYQCSSMGRANKDDYPSRTTCPSMADFDPTTGSLGKWGNCEGPLKNPPAIDLTVP